MAAWTQRQERDDEQGHDRRLYDMTNAWGGRHPLDLTTVVVTHQRPDDRPQDDENFVFVTTAIEDAVARAREIAGWQGRRCQIG
jgi:dihydrofolate reductase